MKNPLFSSQVSNNTYSYLHGLYIANPAREEVATCIMDDYRNWAGPWNLARGRLSRRTT